MAKTVYVCTLDGDTKRIAFSDSDIEDMDGEEMDEQCQFIDRWKGDEMTTAEQVVEALADLRGMFYRLNVAVVSCR